MPDMKYSVIGLGKLGASMMAAIAGRGHSVIGVDINGKAVDAVNNGREPVAETNLGAMISTNRERITATMSHEEAIAGSDVSFVVVPTPSDEQGAFSLQYATWAFREIGKALAVKDGWHLVVLTSTVLPGSTRYGLIPAIEKESGKTCGVDFGLCYSPEFIALGSVIADFLNPDFTLVGEFDDRSGDTLERAYQEIMENSPPCRRMSIENAELTKIALNTFVTTKITYANMLAAICERIPGGDVDVVTGAIGLDSRIGAKYLKGALGYGGPCFPRDNVALSYIAQALQTPADIAETTDRYNRAIAGSIVDRLVRFVGKGSTVAVLGLAYKPATFVIEESQSVSIAKALSKAGARVVAFDPEANDAARAELKDQAVILDSVEQCLEQADVVLVTTPDPAFSSLAADDFRRSGKPVTVIDFWRSLRTELQNADGIDYIPAGCSTEDEINASRLRDLWGGGA